MGAQFIKCSIQRKNDTITSGLPGLDFNNTTSTPLIILNNYLIKIIDYSGVRADNGGNSGIMYKNETKVYGKNYSNKIKRGDMICCDDGRKFVIKSNPVKGIQYLLLVVDEI